MIDIKIISDSGRYHLFLGKTSVWLNATEANMLKKTIDAMVLEENLKDGDFITFEHTDKQNLVAIFCRKTSDGSWHEHASISLDSMELQTGLHITATDDEGYNVRLANDNEKKLLLLALKDSGYSWNAETKRIEIKTFKKESEKYYYFEQENEMAYIAKLIEDCGDGTLRFGEHIMWNPRKQDIAKAEFYETTLVLQKRNYNGLVPATRAEILTLEKIRKKTAKTVDANTCRFKLFEKVLVRDRVDECWFPAIFVKFDKKKEFKYHCLLLDTGASTDFRFCEPYKHHENFVYDDAEILPF